MASPFRPLNVEDETIYCFSDLVKILLEMYKEEAQELNPEFASIFAKGLDCEMNVLEAGLKNLSRLNRNDFKDLLKFIIVEKLLNQETIHDDYYPLILEITTKIRFIEKFDIDFFVDQISLRMMNKNDENIGTLKVLVKSYEFWCNFRDALGDSHDLETEMITMMCPINTFLYRDIGEGSNEEVKRILESVNFAESNGANLKGFRMTFKTFVRNWVMAGKVSEDFNLDSIDSADVVPKYAKIEFGKYEIAQNLNVNIKNLKFYDPKVLFENVDILNTIAIKNDAIKVRVNKCKCPLIEEFVAIKEVIVVNQNDLEPFLNEAKVYKLLSGASRNFVNYYGEKLSNIEIGTAKKLKFELMMEFVDNSLKDDKIHRMQINKPYTEDEIKHIYDQLIESFNVMRQKNILHCDIKPSNILVTSDLTIKIIDFNIARTEIHETTQAVGAYGTLDYMAPEIRIGKQKESSVSIKEDKADVFSLGMTILYLVLDGPEKSLNLEENRNRLRELIENVRYTWLRDSLRKMLDFDYRTRPSLQHLILAHVSEKNRSITVDF